MERLKGKESDLHDEMIPWRKHLKKCRLEDEQQVYIGNETKWLLWRIRLTQLSPRLELVRRFLNMPYINKEDREKFTR